MTQIRPSKSGDVIRWHEFIALPVSTGMRYHRRGGVNLDGLVNLGDHLKLFQFVLGIGASPSAEAITAGDLNGNSILDTGDLVVYPRRLGFYDLSTIDAQALLIGKYS